MLSRMAVSELDLVLQSMRRMTDVMHESYSLAQRSLELDTQRSRIEVTLNTVKQIRELADTWGISITINQASLDSIREVEAEISAREEQVRALGLPAPWFGTWRQQIKADQMPASNRLKVADVLLPSKHAFQETTTSLREILKMAKDASVVDREPHLRQLYRVLCQQEMFWCRGDKSPAATRAGAAQSLAQKNWRELAFDYHEIGYLRLSATKSDTKWFAEAWGEPRQHLAPRQVHSQTWQDAMDETCANMKDVESAKEFSEPKR
jgi:hypothetical protein